MLGTRARPPFPGLLAFQEEDAAVYFGRDDDIRRLIERLEARRAQGGAKLIALLGSSGSGKSSLLRAGVIPRLRRAGRNWIVVPAMRPRIHPVHELARALATACNPPLDWAKLRDDLIGPGPKRALDGFASDLRVKAGTAEAQILIPIDQAEELFGVADLDEARRFLEILSQAVEDLPFMAVLAMRSDFLGQLQSAKSLTARFEEFSLGPMPLARVPQIIEGPARVAGLTVEEAFVQQAARDAETEDALPLLAFALRELLDRSPNKSLTLVGYTALGDEKVGLTPLENAVRKRADDVLAEATPGDDELTALREAFVPAMVRINDKGEYVRRPARWDELPAKSHPLLERLAKARLLIVRQEGDSRMVEVAHEALRFAKRSPRPRSGPTARKPKPTARPKHLRLRAVPVLRRPHDHRRDVRRSAPWALTAAEPDQDRHLMIIAALPASQRRFPSPPPARRTRKLMSSRGRQSFCDRCDRATPAHLATELARPRRFPRQDWEPPARTAAQASHPPTRETARPTSPSGHNVSAR